MKYCNLDKQSNSSNFCNDSEHVAINMKITEEDLFNFRVFDWYLSEESAWPFFWFLYAAKLQ